MIVTLPPLPPYTHTHTYKDTLFPKSSEILTHCSFYHPESFWSMHPMIHYTQFVFTVLPSFYFYFFWVVGGFFEIVSNYTQLFPRTIPTSRISQTPPHLNPSFLSWKILETNSPFAIPQNSLQLCYHGLVTAGVQGLGTSW